MERLLCDTSDKSMWRGKIKTKPERLPINNNKSRARGGLSIIHGRAPAPRIKSFPSLSAISNLQR